LEHWGVITDDQEKLRAVKKEDTGKLRAVSTENPLKLRAVSRDYQQKGGLLPKMTTRNRGLLQRRPMEPRDCYFKRSNRELSFVIHSMARKRAQRKKIIY
jgi:hypothetical protein